MTIRMIAVVLGLAGVALGGCGEGSFRQACADYVTCLEARDAAQGTETDVVRFEPEGECWGTERSSDLCEVACIEGLAFLQDKETGLPEECL